MVTGFHLYLQSPFINCTFAIDFTLGGFPSQIFTLVIVSTIVLFLVYRLICFSFIIILSLFCPVPSIKFVGVLQENDLFESEWKQVATT